MTVETFSSLTITELLDRMTQDVTWKPRATASAYFRAAEYRGRHRGKNKRPDKETLTAIVNRSKNLEQETDNRVLIAFARLINLILDDDQGFDDGLPRQSLEKAMAKIPPVLKTLG